jgi:GntR family histidine utilization transcriptional repressor
MARPDDTLHQKILSDIEDKIMTGVWPASHRIPFERDLAIAYGCSRMTVNKVLTQLARTGMIERRRKSGSFVRPPQAQTAVLQISDIRQEVESLGLTYGYRLVTSHICPADPAEQDRLALSSVSQVRRLVCLHFAGKIPFCLEQRSINLAAVPEAEFADFSLEAPGPWLLARVPWSRAEHRISAMEADQNMGRSLALKTGAACLSVERRTLYQGVYLTFVRLIYPGRNHALTARFTPVATPFD